MDKTWKPNLRQSIAEKVRELRKSRSFTQAELATRLGVSQARLSVIEQGRGSFSAEQFLEILKIFNVPAHSFTKAKRDAQGDLQNALARHGASNLVENAELLPSEHLEEVETLVREVLVDTQNPRQITALAPVIVKNINRLNLNGLWAKFIDYGLEARLGWVLENTVEAIRSLTPSLTSNRDAVPLRKAETAIKNFLERKGPHLVKLSIIDDGEKNLDPIDGKTLSPKTLSSTWATASAVSHRWGIISGLQPEDFKEALRSSGPYIQRRKSHDTV